MGASSSTTELLFFVGAIIVATTIVGVLAGGITSISTGIKERSNSISEKMKSDIAIVNDPSEVPNDPVKIYVKNTGVSIMDQNYLSVVLDGEMVIDFNITFLNTSSYINDSAWGPGEVLEIEVVRVLTAGRHSALVTMKGDVSDRIDFNIE